MYRSSPFRSTWNTNVITGLDMCEVCTEAVHSVALGTRTSSQVWTCVKYVPKQSIPFRRPFSLFPQPLHAFMAQRGFFVYISAGPCLQIRQPFHDSVFGTRQIRQISTTLTRAPYQPGAKNYLSTCRISAINSIPLISSSFNLFSDHQCHLNRMTTSSVLECLVKF